MKEKSRNYSIDLLKGLAILAVVLYHLSGTILPDGYLGVEIFFVISGYFMMCGVLRTMKNGGFSAIKQLMSRLRSLLPGVISVAALSLLFGYFTMLPDDYENLAQSVISSSAFANNILAAITTRNYWDVVNIFKPLMHTWYLGVLMQAYVLLFLLIALCNRLSKNKPKVLLWLMAALTAISLVLFLLPFGSQSDRFYFLPFRLFEITGGALLAFLPGEKRIGRQKFLRAAQFLCGIGLLFFLTARGEYMAASVKLLVVVALTVAYLFCAIRLPDMTHWAIRAPAFLGRNSLTIYLCHQPIVAFMYYCFVPKLTVTALILFTLAVAAASAVLHFALIRPLRKTEQAGKKKRILPLAAAAAVIICGLSGLIYIKAGVVRDVPELGVYKEQTYRGMHAQYCDIPYAWDRDFSDSEKVKVLVYGDSFGRDWANILNESELSEHLEISYIYPYSEQYMQDRAQRIQEADVVFCANSSTSDIYKFCRDNVPAEKLWVVGIKNFGSSNGIVYSRRFSQDYYDTTQQIDPSYISHNNSMKGKYAGHYIDLLQIVQVGEDRVRVFTDDGHFISQDCRHLTQAGAQFYSRQLDLSWLLDEGT